MNVLTPLVKIEGLFRERVNRFLCRVVIEGKETLVYLPNPGRLWELLLPETPVLLTPSRFKGRYPYTLFAVRKNASWVLLDTQMTNLIIEELLLEKRIPFLKDYSVKGKEVKTLKSRFDFLLSDGRKDLLVEVKTCTLFGSRISMFPDAPTERGRRHLLELSELGGMCLFVVMNPESEYFLPAYHVDPTFTSTFLQVRDKVIFKAISLGFDEKLERVISLKELKMPLEILDKVFKPSGAYLLLLELKTDKRISVGKLGEIPFQKGFYVYVGSAMRELHKRLKRHERREKRLRWHIDYLRKYADRLKMIPILTPKKIECELAQNLKSLAQLLIPHFGSSDCNCQSHLFYFEKNPLNSKTFIDLLNFYRLEKPLELIKS
jgi:sugar fermentation stimulation protein A